MAHERLRGRVALVTGGARGLGRATCEVLAEAGVAVVVGDLRQDAATGVAHELCAGGAEAVACALDVTEDESTRAAIEFTLERFGRLDILVNNAGIDVTQPLDELSVEDWDRVLGVNLRGPFLLARRAFPVMREGGGGAIVNVVSTAALRAWPNASAYHASKWGLLGLSHAMHVEGRPHGIRVTAVVSGGMRTDFLFERFPDLDRETLQEPRHVAEAIRFALEQPTGTVVPELLVLPMRETSWP